MATISNNLVPTLLEAIGIDPSTAIKGSINFEKHQPVTVTIERYVSPLEMDQATKALKTEVKNYVLSEVEDIGD